MLPLSESSGRLGARQLVESIAESHGFLGEDVYNQMTTEVRRRVEVAMLIKDELIGSNVITLAKNLYNSSARFVFELLQNADDNSYSRAKTSSTDPYVSFHVYNRRIVVECNEDGFTYENLVAICNIGKSSKSGAQGYAGEKGIGFKSVFMVAWKVLIQSGDLSFCFQHKKGDSGMGMISPIWQDAEDAVASHMTRITLFLHDSIMDDNMQTTLQQFQEIESTFLLFMKNLKRIHVTMYDENDKQHSFAIYSINHQLGNLVDLKTEIRKNGEAEVYSKHYYLTKDIAQGLPMSENRKYTENEISRGAYKTAKVVLAFPLDDKSIPIIQPQHVFAFLPIRKLGFSFLIHTDFVTNASRQDIESSSARNIRLLDGIAEAFIKATSHFCEHSTLRYLWMRYLPQQSDYPWDDFWGKLLKTIYYKLQKLPVLWTRSHNNLRPIQGMRRLKYDMLDGKGNPLFSDSNPERYLASEYSATDLEKLNNCGLESMQTEEFLDKVRLDLDKNSQSVVKASATDEDWHSRLAKFLISALRNYPDKIRSFGIIPLIGGRWTASRNTTIYYSHAKQHPIPTDLGLNLVDPQAVRNPERKRLFDSLGVKNPKISNTRKLIFDKYEYNSITVRDFATSRNHLVFLYLTTHLNMVNDKMDSISYLRLNILDQKCRCKWPQNDIVYFSDDKPYGAKELFQAINHDTRSQKIVPGLDVSFMHHEYMESPPSQPEGEHRSWRTWLRDMLHISDAIPLFSNRALLTPDYHLSDECLYVAKHRPEKFLGFLLENWKESDSEKINTTPRLTKDLLQLKVLCANGTMHPLGRTYLQIDEHKNANRFFEDTEFFPWLRIEATLSNVATLSKLQVLTTRLGFGYFKSDVEFYLRILLYIHLSNLDASELKKETRIYDLYSRIEARYRESVDRDICRQEIENAFISSLIYVPEIGSQAACWAEPDECLWEAPTHMLTKFSLKSRYENVENNAYFNFLFCGILKIRNANVDDLIEELTSMQDIEDPDFDQICDIYKHIHDLTLHIDNSERIRIREKFETGLLVYVAGDDGTTYEWYSVSECLWSTTTGIKGMTTIREQYEDMFDFFVEFLGVPTLTLEMVVDKLADQGAEETSIQDIKTSIWQLNALLKKEENHPSPNQILKRKVFPIKCSGEGVDLRSSETDFAIADREQLLYLFSGKSNILDFEVNDILRLEPFLRWTGLESRYLSRSVKEISGLCSGDSQRLVAHDRDIALKAHGLLRIAVHFGSPRVQSGEQPFYDELKKIEVRETDGISSQLHLSQDGRVIKVEMNRSELHLQDHQDGLKIYIPRDEDMQYQCFLDRMPKALLEWIMTDPKTGICEKFNDKAINAICTVIQAQNKYISETMNRAGIMSVETPDDSVNDGPNLISPVLPQPVEEEYISTGSQGGSDLERDTSVQNVRNTSSHGNLVDISNGERRGTTSSHIPSSPRVAQSNQVDLEYLRILRSAVNSARRAAFPSRGTFDMAALARSLPTVLPENNGEYFGLRSSEKIERDKKIGAAGELYVFEVLSRLTPTLPGFSRSNWKSNLRKYVTIHDDYATLSPWRGVETADITYDDTESILTNFLVDKGYLNTSDWSGKRPRYFLEVKSTTGPCENAFYMSRSQYELMQANSNGHMGSGQTDSIYVIFRVFDVGKDSMEMKVYVDPETMRERAELLFTAKTWSILPGYSQS
ncbi:hypothetical protein BGW36DRAFT_376264 [Talaromyces proteolyticus]|uniref:Protein NO VEIN C-terminal domain-containing protein n=1 Tax=Talaromyces proteolyticus TaxID=1131652 RepID=A0AAD4KWL5_9EURO|nr:uncharacterized protein BGW36DRAFT_376264 [Talaromyces proteolyticus]KAH8698523.1 hypothetical protein BGW36DRAFT_376264 [Talaromyces proteolyticus]